MAAINGYKKFGGLGLNNNGPGWAKITRPLQGSSVSCKVHWFSSVCLILLVSKLHHAYVISEVCLCEFSVI